MTDVEPYSFSAPLTVCVDVAHPECWLALAPVQALAAELGISVDWLPFPTPLPQTPQETPPGVPESRGVRHRRLRARYRQADLERYAAAQGLRLRARRDPIDGTRASLGLLWLQQRDPQRCGAYLEAVCRAYWSAAHDENGAAVEQALRAAGLDPAEFPDFAAGPGPRQLARLRASLVAGGVFTVPTLIVEREPYVGRAHLPMVRRLLNGRVGPPTT